MKNTLLWTGIAVVVLLAIVAFVYQPVTHNSGQNGSEPNVPMADQSNEDPGQTRQDALAAQAAVSSNTAATVYHHQNPAFSFTKPTGYTVGAIPGENGGQTLIVQRASPSETSAKDGFQIMITPLDSPMTLTPDLIKSELPGIAITNPQAIVLDTKGRGLMFASNNDSFGGHSYEIWFTTSTHLYQVTSYASFANQLQTIIGSWHFK